jgi:hypothetical protein
LIEPKSAQVGKQNPDPGPSRGMRAVAREKSHGTILFPGRFPVMNSKKIFFSVQILFKFELIL